MKINEPFWAAFEKINGELAGHWGGVFTASSYAQVVNDIGYEGHTLDNYNIICVTMISTAKESSK